MTRSPLGWNAGRGEVEVNGRVTYLPVYEDKGRQLVHVGIGAAARELDDGQARFRARFDARNSPSGFAALLADTGVVRGSHQQFVVPELAAVNGPLSFQAEAYASWVKGPRRSPPTARLGRRRAPPSSGPPTPKSTTS